MFFFGCGKIYPFNPPLLMTPKPSDFFQFFFFGANLESIDKAQELPQKRAFPLSRVFLPPPPHLFLLTLILLDHPFLCI